MRALHRPHDHRHIVESIVLSFECQFRRGEALADDRKRLVIHFPGFREVEAVCLRLERRYAASHAQQEAARAHLIEHADFFDQA